MKMTQQAHKRLAHLMGMGLIAIGIGIFGLMAFRENIIFFLTPSELNAQKETMRGKKIRLGGLVQNGSLQRQDFDITFRVSDTHNELTVHYKGPIPALFREGQGVVATGIFDDNIFQATQILTKHDERYVPKQVVERLKKDQLWRDMTFIYKILLPSEWKSFQETKIFKGSPLDQKDGFIHNSTLEQRTDIQEKFFKDQEVVILKIDVSKIQPGCLKFEENKPGGNVYPHIYGDIPFEAVCGVELGGCFQK